MKTHDIVVMDSSYGHQGSCYGFFIESLWCGFETKSPHVFSGVLMFRNMISLSIFHNQKVQFMNCKLISIAQILLSILDSSFDITFYISEMSECKYVLYYKYHKKIAVSQPWGHNRWNFYAVFIT